MVVVVVAVGGGNLPPSRPVLSRAQCAQPSVRCTRTAPCVRPRQNCGPAANLPPQWGVLTRPLKP